MAELVRQVHERLARQHGVASTDELLADGVTRWGIGDLVRRGALVPVLPGAYRSPSTPDTEEQRCAALCRAHPELVIAGPTAGRFWELRRLPSDLRVHVLGPPHCHPTKQPWVKVFRTPTWTGADVLDRKDGIRVLKLPRLCLDLARFVNDVDLLSIVEQGMDRGSHSVREMVEVAADWISPRRRWVQRYLEAVDRRIDGPAAESHLEVIVGDRLKQAGVRGLVRQYPTTLPGYGSVRFDLAVPSACWAVEVDGFPTHREVDGAQADARRDTAAVACGWTVRRVSPFDLGARLDDTIDRLAADARTRSNAVRTGEM